MTQLLLDQQIFRKVSTFI